MKHPHPPRLADKILKWYCSDDYFEEVQGDLHEWFHQRVEEVGYGRARRAYYLDVVRYFRSFRLKKTYQLGNNSKLSYMKSIFKLTYRNLRRDGLSAMLRIGNLSLGIVVFLLTLVYARYELSYDTFHNGYDKIYRTGQSLRGKAWAAGPIGLGAYLKSDVAGVEAMTRVFPARNSWIKRGDKIFTEKNGHLVDPEFFEVFNHKSINGRLDEALSDVRAIVLTEELARKYFGNENPIGQLVQLDNEEGESRIVTAVIENVPEQSHLQFDFLLPLTTFSGEFRTAWRNFGTYTYVRLSEGTDLGKLNETVQKEYEARYPNIDEGLLKTFMTPITEIHLRTNHEKELADNGNVNYVYILLSVGIFVLLISCTNFVNLSVIKGLDRGKEVGLRKTIGATKSEIVGQFVGENLIVILISALLSLIALAAFAPMFRNFSELNLPLNGFYNPEILVPVAVLVVLLELVCGVYPAIALSKFKPADVLKMGARGSFSNKRLSFLRKGLITLQFGISLVMIASSFLIYNQVDYIQNRDMGFEKDQILLINLDGKVRNKFGALRDGLKRIPGVQAVSASTDVPGYRISMEPVIEVGVVSNEAPENIRTIRSDDEFLTAYGIQVKEGRDFRKESPEGVTEYLLNEAAANFIFDDRDPIGKNVVYRRDTGRVVGIIQNFNYKTIHTEVEPLVISSNARLRLASIRFDPQRTEEVLAGIASLSEEILPGTPPIEAEFLSLRFAHLYKAETKLKTLVWLFCLISIVLTMSGILGVATYIAKQKMKEIAIRKVLGSGVASLFGLMSKSFLMLLLLSVIISIPVAYYLSGWWLQNFAYQVPVGISGFVLSVLGVFLLVLFSSGLVTFKVIKANPIEALKND